MNKKCLFLSCCLPLCFASAQDTAEPVKISMHTEAKVGQKYELKVKGTTTREMSLWHDGQEVGRKQMIRDGSLLADVEVKEISAAKFEKKITLKIKEFSATLDPEELPTKLSAGTEIEVTPDKSGGGTFKIKGEEVEADLDEILDVLVPMDLDYDPKDLPTLDEAYGVNEKRAPGSSWDIPVDKLSKLEAAKTPGFMPIKEKSKGSMSLRRLSKVNDIPCVGVVSVLEMAVEPTKEVVGNLKDAAVKLNATIRGKHPLDASLVIPEQEIDVVFDIKGMEKEDHEMRMRVSTTATFERKAN